MMISMNFYQRMYNQMCENLDLGTKVLFVPSARKAGQTYAFKLREQNIILTKLINETATKKDYEKADNITRARYADYIWSNQSIAFRHHFMFHTSKEFNGFKDGTHLCDENCDYLQEEYGRKL